MFIDIKDLESITFFNNNLNNYLNSLIIFLLSLIFLKITQIFIVRYLKRLALKTKTDFDDLLIEIFESLRPPFYLLISFYIAIQNLNLSNILKKIIYIFFLISISLEILNGINKLIFYFLDKYLQKKQKKEKKKINLALINTLKFFIKLSLWTITLLTILANLGINVSSIIASLGIGGIAVALAMQNILSDIFSAFSIYFDRPFELDDFIQIGNYSGRVKHIGLKTTRLETLQGEELIISNRDLTNAKIQNFKRMQKRRVQFEIGLEYNTKTEKLEKIAEYIKNIIENSGAEYERCFFTKFADSSLIYEISYYINSSDYTEYLKINHNINIAILEKFRKENLNFAYPSQSIYLNK